MRSGTSLRRSEEFRRVRVEGTRTSSPEMTVYVCEQVARGGPSRLGLAVGRTVGAATTRNRVRRRVRAAWNHVPPPGGLDVVVVAHPPASNAEFQKMVAVLNAATGTGVER